MAHCAETFRKIFADDEGGDRLQSGIHINQFDGAEDFRREIAKLKLFSTPLYWRADYCSIRCQKPNELKKALPWHQDAAVVLGRTFGWTSGHVVWMPFTPIDDSTPGLELIDTRWPLLHRGNKTTGYLESVLAPWGRRSTIGAMALGDVLVFDINCPHRTHVTGTMSKPRLSVDLRFTTTVPATYQGKLIRCGGVS